MNENMSRSGTAPLARIQSPARICQPVSPSRSIVLAPFIQRYAQTIGITNATSVIDGMTAKILWRF